VAPPHHERTKLQSANTRPAARASPGGAVDQAMQVESVSSMLTLPAFDLGNIETFSISLSMDCEASCIRLHHLGLLRVQGEVAQQVVPDDALSGGAIRGYRGGGTVLSPGLPLPHGAAESNRRVRACRRRATRSCPPSDPCRACGSLSSKALNEAHRAKPTTVSPSELYKYGPALSGNRDAKMINTGRRRTAARRLPVLNMKKVTARDIDDFRTDAARCKKPPADRWNQLNITLRQDQVAHHRYQEQQIGLAGG